MMIACVNGSGIPILVDMRNKLAIVYRRHIMFNPKARLLNLDPAKIAGPMETAFQDVVGQSFLLGVSYLIFSVTEDRLHALHF